MRGLASTSNERTLGQITFLETLGLFVAVSVLPFVQAFRLFCKPFNQLDRARTWRRVKADATVRFFSSVLNAYQIQFVDKSSQNVYEKWAPNAGVHVDVEKIDEEAVLLWATPRKRKRVILYFPGGGYVLPAVPFTYTFWKHVGDILNEKEEDYSVAFLDYSLIPKVKFPAFVKQTIASIKHLISCGYSPEDILLVGDSAGAGLILQVIAHMLHPIPGVPEFSLPSPIGAAIFMSPYVVVRVESPSFFSYADVDVFPLAFFQHLKDLVIPAIPEDQLHYVEASRAPQDWFKGADKLISRVLITVGETECLRDPIESFAQSFCEAHEATSLIYIPKGTHNEPYGTMLAAEPDVGPWPSRLAEWLAEGTTSWC